MITKPKNSQKYLHIAINLALVSAFLLQTINPVVVSAKIWKNGNSEVVLTQTQESRMFSPNIAKKPNYTLNAIITAYTSTPGQTDDSPFIAAWGERVHDGMIANNCLPHNAIVKIPEIYGNKVFRVKDRMNSRYGCERFDIWLDTTRAEARKFGVKRVVVEIHLPEKAPMHLAIAQ